jgi:hypothetical protein
MGCINRHPSSVNGERRTSRGRIACAAAALGLLIAACGSSSPTAPTPPSSPVLRVALADPAGDALPDSRVSSTPDLVNGVVEVDGTNLRFRVTLAEASIDRATGFVQIHLDLDQNPSTGIKGIQEQVDIGVIGAEAVLLLLDGLQRAQLLRCDGPSCRLLDSYSTTLVGGVLEGVVPMSAIVDDGRMNVKISSLVAVNGMGGSGPTDVMPNVGQPAPPTQ